MSPSPFLKFEEINPESTPTHTVIWLHGLGANGCDFVPIASSLSNHADCALRFIFPHAPVQSVTLNMGMSMPSWYDIYGLAENSKQDVTGITQARGWIEELIAHEIDRHIPSHHILIAGFSQGGALALATALLHKQPLAGCVALSCYLPIATQLMPNLAPANCKLPLFIAHGEHDTVVPYAWGEKSYHHLANQDYPIAWRSYPMTHTTCEKEITDIDNWLGNTLTLS